MSYLDPLKKNKKDFILIIGQKWDFPGWPLTFAHSVRSATHLSMTSRTAGRHSATSTLVSQPETSDPIQPRSTIQIPPVPLFSFVHFNTGSLVQGLPKTLNPTTREKYKEPSYKVFESPNPLCFVCTAPWITNFSKILLPVHPVAALPLFFSIREFTLFFPDKSVTQKVWPSLFASPPPVKRAC